MGREEDELVADARGCCLSARCVALESLWRALSDSENMRIGYNPAVAEAGAIGRPDELRGEVVAVFVVLRQGNQPSEQMRHELLETVRHWLGPVAVIGEINFVSGLPKTRSGKIMRRVLKAVILDRDPGDISTIEDAASVEDARSAWLEMRREVRAGS